MHEEDLYFLRTLIGTAVGHSSTCWKKLDLAGEFDSVEAKKITDELVKEIYHFIREARIEALRDYLDLGPEKVELLLNAIENEKRKISIT